MKQNQTTMTLEEAEQIRQAFGPNTTLYECYTVGEIVEQFKEGNSNVWGFLILLMGAFDIYCDQSADAAYHRAQGMGSETYHQLVIDELTDSRTGIVKRLHALFEGVVEYHGQL